MSNDRPLFDNFDGRKMLALVERWRPLADGVIPPPVACSLDLSSAALCPNRCYFCNVRRTQTDGGNMTDETFAEVLKVFKFFGVKSCCVAGGGESLVNPRTTEYLRRIVDGGTQVGVITNGRIYRELPKECRFVNVSVNAADRRTYSRMAGVDRKHFKGVLRNIRRWIADGQNVCYKVMMTDRNKSPLLLARSVDMAMKLGCRSVLFRFAMLPWDMVGIGEPEYVSLSDLEADLFTSHVEILRKHYPQINIQMPLERYDRSSQKFVPKRCTGGAVNFVILWDGVVSICSDLRTNPAMLLCRVSELKDFWGGEKHKDMLAAVDPSRCPRCSFFMHDRIADEFVYSDMSNQFFI